MAENDIDRPVDRAADRSVPQVTLIPMAVPVMLLAFFLLLRRPLIESGAAKLCHFATRLWPIVDNKARQYDRARRTATE